MKKTLLFSISTILLASCQTITKTSRTETIQSSARNVTVADLEVYPERVTATIQVDKSLMRGGESNVRHAAEAEALAEYGKGDLLLEPQYVVKKKRGLLRTRITEISVSGRPASYKNFRSLDDSVWTNPVFNGVKMAGGNSKPAPTKADNTRKEKSLDAPKVKRTWRSPGFTGAIELKGGGCDKDDISNTDVEVDVTLGYQINPHWMVGLGCGYSRTEPDEDSNIYHLQLVPVFAQARWYTLRTRFTPFVDMKLGYAIPCWSESEYGEDNIKDSSMGGFYMSPSIGVAYTTKRDHTITLAFSYKMNRVDEDFVYNYRDFHGFDTGKHTIGASLGFTF